MPLIALRHTTPAAPPGTCYGRTDVPVAEGFEAELSALMPALPVTEVIVSSPLSRCRVLAERVGEARGQPIAIDPRLSEIDFGAWEGLPWDDVPRNELDAWAADVMGAAPHGGESVRALRDRVRAALGDYRADGRSHLLVTHAGVVRAAMATGDTTDDLDTKLGFGRWLRLA